MLSENIWGAVRVDPLPDGGHSKLLSTVVNGVRLWREQHWSMESPDGEKELRAERYYTTDPGRAHRTAEAALAAVAEPVEPNNP